MPDPVPQPPLPPGTAPDGNRELILSGVWVAKPFVPIEAFPDALVLTAADRKLASRLREPVRLCRRRFGAHDVELLVARGEDRSVALSLRIPTAANQFKDPYLLMEAEPGNTREVGVRELQFHLQGRLAQADLEAADWAGYLAAAAAALEALRAAKRKTAPARRAPKARARKAAPRKAARAKKKVARKPARGAARRRR
jgi:hypothetical protein